jgi:hypothetical protein
LKTQLHAVTADNLFLPTRFRQQKKNAHVAALKFLIGLIGMAEIVLLIPIFGWKLDTKMIEQLPAQYAKFLALHGSRLILAAK